MTATDNERPGPPPRSAGCAGPRAARSATAAALAGLLALPACADPAPDSTPGIAVADLTGRSVTLPAPARRVVSMMPSVTEWIMALGAEDRLVARTDYDRQPALADLPSVGGGLTPSVEWLAALQPDLVVAWPDAPSRSVVGRLESLGIPVYAAPAESIDDALHAARDLGALLGTPRAADRAIEEVRAGLDSVRAAVADCGHPGVLFLIGIDPVMAAGPGTFVDELIGVAGGRNVLRDTQVRWPRLSLEDIVRRRPDILIVGTAADDPAMRLGSRPGWREIPAVRRGHVHPVDPDLVNRPGPRLDEAAALLARLIHHARPDHVR